MKIKKIKDLIQIKDNIIFDFDGVITDSVNIKTEAFAELYSKYGSSIKKKVVNHHLEHGGISRFDKIKYYHDEFLGIKLKKDELKLLCDNFSKLVINKVIKAPEINGSEKFLSDMKKNNKSMFINTGTPIDEMKFILDKKNLTKYFNEILGSPKTKIENIEIIMKKYKYKAADILFFGDSKEDLESANYFNIVFVGIGENIKKFLDKNKCYYINNFNELYK